MLTRLIISRYKDIDKNNYHFGLDAAQLVYLFLLLCFVCKFFFEKGCAWLFVGPSNGPRIGSRMQSSVRPMVRIYWPIKARNNVSDRVT